MPNSTVRSWSPSSSKSRLAYPKTYELRFELTPWPAGKANPALVNVPPVFKKSSVS